MGRWDLFAGVAGGTAGAVDVGVDIADIESKPLLSKSECSRGGGSRVKPSSIFVLRPSTFRYPVSPSTTPVASAT